MSCIPWWWVVGLLVVELWLMVVMSAKMIRDEGLYWRAVGHSEGFIEAMQVKQEVK